MSRLSAILIVLCLILCVSTCSKLAYEPTEPDQEVTTIPDAAPVIQIITLDNGISIVHDHETGCQYIMYKRTGAAITPRINTDGTHVCLTQAGTGEWEAAAEEDYLDGEFDERI